MKEYLLKFSDLTILDWIFISLAGGIVINLFNLILKKIANASRKGITHTMQRVFNALKLAKSNKEFKKMLKNDFIESKVFTKLYIKKMKKTLTPLEQKVFDRYKELNPPILESEIDIKVNPYKLPDFDFNQNKKY
ncbi:hypothetical protein [Sporosarcina sp. NPDC096371]|uniref:hypothetical protein n=1 Tax=Sporosarcina sp. NPDC096371 TaxID=3364530 RepID=UPI0037FA9E71